MGGIRAQETRDKRPSHPKYSAMVRAAIGVLRERLGSSRQAIQKYILTTYSVKDEKKTYTHIKIALKRGVDSGCLTQIRGSGASGSFKLADARKAESRGPRKTTAHGYVCKKTFVKVAGAENPAGGRQTGQRFLSKAETEERSRMRDFIAREAVTKAKSANRVSVKQSFTRVKTLSRTSVKKSNNMTVKKSFVKAKTSTEISVKKSNMSAVKKSITKAKADNKTSVRKSASQLPSKGKPNVQKFTLKKAARAVGRKATKMIKKTAVAVRKKLKE